MEPVSKAAQLMNAHDYLDGIIRELQALDKPQKTTLVGVLQYLSDHIRTTRDEISALRAERGSSPMFSDTADELEEIVGETARAANRIMDAAESIEQVAATAEPGAASALTEAVTNIYEASAFQDITGQRITKIVRALQSMEVKLASLVEAFGPMEPQAPAPAPQGDDRLLNGPQLQKAASSQTDIDALFESLG
jgi:chemotaxis protein CheZ